MEQNKKTHAATSNWSDQYKSPKWQKKRLEILERDGFKCCKCGDKESQLHVHHTRYISGVKVWEHPDNVLLTLCNTCHDEMHKGLDWIKHELASIQSYCRFYEGDAFKKTLDFFMAIYIAGPDDYMVKNIFNAIDLFYKAQESDKETRREFEV